MERWICEDKNQDSRKWSSFDSPEKCIEGELYQHSSKEKSNLFECIVILLESINRKCLMNNIEEY